MARNLTDNPRVFWRAFQTQARADNPVSMAQWTTYFKGMFEANTAGVYWGGSIEAHCLHHGELFPPPTDTARQGAARLNRPFSRAEVDAALARLPNNKAAGIDGMPAEFITQAWVPAEDEEGKTVRHYILAPYLAQLFTTVLQGPYPEAWGTSALAPGPKANGKPDDPNDYRGIAVGPVLAKLYSLCLFARMVGRGASA
jgi:hypothetical protein